jgi:RimJ/RimL family protein N-acetyltransferase
VSKKLNEIELEGDLVRLVPMKRKHRNDLIEAASDGELWNLWYTAVPSENTIDRYLDIVEAEFNKDLALAFVVIDKRTQRIVGSTRYCNCDMENRRVEIGYTWYSKSMQRTGINTECKYLLLTHAFEKLNCIAVEFRTNWHNTQSKRAIERLGAKQDGLLRNHRISADGIIRDTIVYSIIQGEWGAVKKLLSEKMKAYK